MSDSSGKPWSDNPYAPHITPRLYFAEKTNFAGFLIGAILYGIVIVLFFQCMGALLNPVNRTRGIKWALVAHTAAMFSFVTIYTAINLDIQSISYIDNREFPGVDSIPWPGPVGYQTLITSKAISVVPTIVFVLNTWLADGLLLYRCYVICAANYWVIVFPCLMYLVTVAMGIAFTYQCSQPASLLSNYVADYGTAYYSISISLNVLLTLMIVTRLILHHKNIRDALGPLARTGGLYKTIVTILTESCALYAVTYLLFIGPWASASPVSNIFFPILAETQVIAPFLITLRVANQSALTNKTIVSGDIGSIHFRQGKSNGGSGTLPGGQPTSSVDTDGESPV